MEKRKFNEKEIHNKDVNLYKEVILIAYKSNEHMYR